MKLTDIITGIKLELELFNDMNKRINPIFTSQFEHALDDDHAIIYAPIHEGNIYPVHIGWTSIVYFVNEENYYRFFAEIIDRKTNDNLSLLVIKIKGDIEKIQRRLFYRFYCNLPIRYRIIDSIANTCCNKPDFVETITRDLSGGGLCIKLKEKIGINNLVEFELILNKREKISFIGLVVRSNKTDDNEHVYKYEMGVVYKDINNKDRDRIIKFIYAEQRKLRRKGFNN